MPERHSSHVVGFFATPEAAREALVRIEALGIDADAIDLIGLEDAMPTRPKAQTADLEAVGSVVKRSATGAVIGAIAGAIVGLIAWLVSGDVTTGAIVGVAAVVGGAVIGLLAGTYARLPVNEAAWTTYELDPSDPHPITVRVRVADAEEAERVRAALLNRPRTRRV